MQPPYQSALPILLHHRKQHAAPACTAQGQTLPLPLLPPRRCRCRRHAALSPPTLTQTYRATLALPRIATCRFAYSQRCRRAQAPNAPAHFQRARLGRPCRPYRLFPDLHVATKPATGETGAGLAGALAAAAALPPSCHPFPAMSTGFSSNLSLGCYGDGSGSP